MLWGYKIKLTASCFLYQYTSFEEGNSISKCRSKTLHIRPEEDEAAQEVNDATVWGRGGEE
jgi:hypothetical protein